MSRLETQSPDIVLITETSESIYNFEYFFGSIFGHSTVFLKDRNAALLAFRARKFSKAKLFALYVEQFDEMTAALLNVLKSRLPQTFVLVLTEDVRPVTSVQLYEANVDEVVRYPFELQELAYRLRARSHEIGLTFDFGKEQAKKMKIASDISRRVELTDIEAQVMHVLLLREGETVSRDELSLTIDKTSWNYGNRKFDVHVGHIRKKLNTAFCGALSVRTVRSAGYKLSIN